MDKVLGELAGPTEPDRVTLRELDDLLVAGLAWAAATGDTCRIQSAVQAVRVAREKLVGDGDGDGVDPAGARSALLAARERLGRPPAERRGAPVPRTETDTERDLSRRYRAAHPPEPPGEDTAPTGDGADKAAPARSRP